MEQQFVIVCFVRNQRRFLSMRNNAPTITEDFAGAETFTRPLALVALLAMKGAFNVVGTRIATVDEAQNVTQ